MSPKNSEKFPDSFLTKQTRFQKLGVDDFRGWVFVGTDKSDSVFKKVKEEKQELMNTFKILDLNGDGKLSREELIIGN